MPFDHTVHHTVKTREGTVAGRTTPYIIVGGLEGQVFIQDGQFLTAGGEVIEDVDVPDWAWNMALDLSAAARDEVGLPPLPEKEKPEAKARVDLRPPQGNPPMQLNAGDAETDGKASPVPQDQDAASPKAVAKGPTPPIVKK